MLLNRAVDSADLSLLFGSSSLRSHRCIREALGASLPIPAVVNLVGTPLKHDDPLRHWRQELCMMRKIMLVKDMFELTFMGLGDRTICQKNERLFATTFKTGGFLEFVL